MYYYDIYGWYSSTPIEGRSTNIAPPTDIPEGYAANFTGIDWVVIPFTPQPSENELIQITKQNALAALQATDWTGAQGVDNPLNVPYLGNLAEFNKYRAAVRNIYLNPTANAVLPQCPISDWIYPVTTPTI